MINDYDLVNKLHNENCLATMARMSDNYIDLTVTSPPYDKLRKYNGYSFDFESIARELFRVTAGGGIVIWVVGDSTIKGSESGSSFRQALFFQSIGFRLHDTMIYAKNNYIPLTHNRYEQSFEFMFCFSKGRPKTFNPIRVPSKLSGKTFNLSRKGYSATVKEGAQRRREELSTIGATKIKSNIFHYSCGGDRLGHPAPFPKDLARDQILTWSNPGDIVYDPMSGSGTTPMQARILNRYWIASETSEEYCKKSLTRINS